MATTIADEIKTLVEANRKSLQELFKKGLQEVFDEFPDIEFISWTQYTPYFNDGDECTFRVGEAYINGEDDRYHPSYHKLKDQRKIDLLNQEKAAAETAKNYREVVRLEDEIARVPGYTAERLAALQRLEPANDKIDALFASIPEETMKLMFKDHVSVTYKRTGEIDIETYDHE